MKYDRIMRTIERRIEEGQFKAGSKLPSVRALSEEFRCSKSTVMKAYEELQKKHVVYSVSKSGYYVVDDGRFHKQRSQTFEKIDFLSAGPDKKAMPYRDFQHCINQAIDRYKEDMFTYSDIQGLYTLRRQLARHLQDLQVFTVPERICVVSGSQQAIHLLLSLPFPNGKQNLCVEQPSHPSLIHSAQQQHANVYGIELTKHGIDLDQLEQLFKHQNIKCFYTVSRFHNPTGYSYTNAEKRKIVQLAQKYDVYIIEDDYMGDLDINLKQDPMFAYDPSGRIIYIKSFSKVMLPGLRLGLAVIPETIRERFLHAKFAMDLHTPVLTQGALEIYLNSGMFRAHIQKMREMYHRKALLLQEAYQIHLPKTVNYSCALSGFYSSIELPKPIKAKQLIDRMRKDHVYLDDCKRMYLPEFAQQHIVRLSVSQVEEHLISRGIRLIAQGISDLWEASLLPIRFR